MTHRVTMPAIISGSAGRIVTALLLACVLLLYLIPVMVQAADKYSVEIVGAGPLDDLLNKHLEIRRHENDPALSEDELRRLVDITPQQIRDLLATEGYFSPQVEGSLEQSDGGRVARFRVAPGEPTQVDRVEIRFAGDIAQGPNRDQQRMDRLRRRWSLKPGERFRQAAWTDAKNDLLKNLLVRDYPAAAIVSSEALIDPGQRTASLTVDVDSGPAFTFGELQVDGLQRYPRAIIDQLNPIKPGEPYSQDKLTELQSRLQDTGYFRSAFASVEPDPARPKLAPVHVDVTENERKRLSFGVGFSTDAGARVETRWLDRTFLGRQWRLQTNLLVDRQTRRLGASVFLPALRNGWRPIIDTRLERTDTEGELTDTLRVGGRITSPQKTDEQTWGAYFLADRQRINDIFLNDRQAVLISYTYTRRRVDDLINPQRGYIASIDAGAGIAGLGEAARFGRLVGNATLLSEPGRRWQTVLRGQAGQVFGASRFLVPSDLLFRTGGDQTVRGYAYNSIGVEQDGAVVGGTVLAVMSAELVYRITPQWGAAVFTDVGDAADSWREFHLRRGTGVGARWQSPIGPVRIDLAYGHQVHEVRLHFSVGYGF